MSDMKMIVLCKLLMYGKGVDEKFVIEIMFCELLVGDYELVE